MTDIVESNAKAQINILNELLYDMKDSNIEISSHIGGLIDNYKERLEKHLTEYLENKK